MPSPHQLNRQHGHYPARFLHLATGDGILALDVQAALEVVALADGSSVEEAESVAAAVDINHLREFHAARDLYTRLRSLHRWELCPHGYATAMSLSSSGPRRSGPFVIRSPWDPVPENGLDIVIDPGLSFGLGTHATTWLPLRQMVAYVQSGMVCADVGCGSGVLSIALSRLGASRVEAVDRDVLAVLEALDNVRRNSVEEVVTPIHQGSAVDLTRPAELVVANMGGAPQVIDIAPGVARHLLPGGLFLASGIYGDDDAGAQAAADGVSRALEPLGLREERREMDHHCVGMVFRRAE